MVQINLKKWIPVYITFGFYIQVFFEYLLNDMWITSMGAMEFVVLTLITMFLAVVLIFIHRLRRFYYPFAPIFWLIGLMIILLALFSTSVVPMYVGFLFILPAQFFMFFIFWYSNNGSK